MEPIAEAAAPNWAEITTEPQCPLCEYMLRGLNVARCPECGFRFEWAEVLDASKREHPYLFEHHPERNIWSYFKTVMGAARPRRFWSQLHPAQYGSRRRLLIFLFLGLAALITIALITPAIFIMILAALEPYSPRYQSFYRYSRPPYWDLVGDALLAAYSRWRTQRLFLNGLLVAVTWPWIAFLALQVFQISMRKAKVKSIHVLRCVIYALDHWVIIRVWILVVSSILIFEVVDMYRLTYMPLPGPAAISVACASFVVVLHTYRLGVAYGRYLRFDHAMPVAISAQLITLLSTLILLLFINLP